MYHTVIFYFTQMTGMRIYRLCNSKAFRVLHKLMFVITRKCQCTFITHLHMHEINHLPQTNYLFCLRHAQHHLPHWHATVPVTPAERIAGGCQSHAPVALHLHRRPLLGHAGVPTGIRLREEEAAHILETTNELVCSFGLVDEIGKVWLVFWTDQGAYIAL